MSSIFFVIGGIMGMGLVWADRLFYVYFTRPHEQLSVHIQHLVKGRRYREALLVLKMRGHEQQHLTVRSVLFMGVWIPVALFILTSTASFLARGFVMGIGLHLLYDIYIDWGNRQRLRDWLFWPVRRDVADSELKVVVGVYVAFFILLSLLLL
jgi:hypothetical protein